MFILILLLKSKILNKREFKKLPLKVQEMVATKYQEEAVWVEVIGLVALLKGMKFFLKLR